MPRVARSTINQPDQAFDPRALRKEIESLVVNQGPLVGEPFKVLPWQFGVLKSVAMYRETALTISRGNGKTTFIAALACSAITPGKAMFVPRGEVLIAAPSMQQGRICFEHIREFMRPDMYEWVDDELLLKRKIWKENFNTHQMEISHKPTGTKLKVIGSDPKRAHGLAPSMLICDEPAQFESGGDVFYAALRTSLGKQANPRMLVIGTRPRSPLHFFSRLLFNPPDGTNSIIYAAEQKDVEDGGAYKIRTIKKANPSYNHLSALRTEIKEFKEGARKQGGIRRAQYYALYLNMGTSEADDTEDAVDAEQWEVITKKSIPQRQGDVAIGVDLGGGNSLSACALYWYETGRLECWGCVPAFPPLQERGERDGVGGAYIEMHDMDVLRVHGQKETRNSDFLREIFQDAEDYDWLGVACDRYKINAVKQAVLDAGYGDDIIVDRAVGMGSDGWDDLNLFRTAILEEYLRPGVNLALEHAIMSAVVKRDRNGNASLDKSWQRGRIDVLQAVIHAVGLGERIRKPVEAPTQPFDVSQFVAIA